MRPRASPRQRAEAFGRTDAPWPATASIKAKELFYERRMDERWSGSVGLQHRNWGSGLSFHPLGFLTSAVDLSDPFDGDGRIKGLPMLVVTRWPSAATPCS